MNLQDFLERGVANVIPSKSKLETLLKSQKKLNVYVGVDPTSPKMHLGHTVALRKLNQLVQAGHNVTFLIGDFTTLVGDTSDKQTERPVLDPEEITKNFRTYQAQAEKVLDFSKVKVVRNSTWLSKLTFKEIIRLFQNFSLNDFISRELIRDRLEAGKRVRLDETIYPLMQGYDSYILDTDLQIGGTDQTFNMQAGRTLLKNLKNKDSFIISTEFLTGTDGRKMSKSWNNAIWLTDTPEDVYGKIMSLRDELIIEYFTLLTQKPLADIRQMKKDLDSGTLHPLKLKQQLAFELTGQLHGDSAAKEAAQHFSHFYQAALPVPFTPKITTGPALDLFASLSPNTSRSQIRRLLTQGAASLNDQKILDPKASVTLKKGDTLSLGRHIKLKVK